MSVFWNTKVKIFYQDNDLVFEKDIKEIIFGVPQGHFTSSGSFLIN